MAIFYLVVVFFVFSFTRQGIYDKIYNDNAVSFKEYQDNILVYVIDTGDFYNAHIFTKNGHLNRFRLYMQIIYSDQSRVTVFAPGITTDIVFRGESIQTAEPVEWRPRFSTFEIIGWSIVLLSFFINMTRLAYSIIYKALSKRLAKKHQP